MLNLFIGFIILWSIFVIIFACKTLKETRELQKKIKVKSEYIHKYTRNNV